VQVASALARYTINGVHPPLAALVMRVVGVDSYRLVAVTLWRFWYDCEIWIVAAVALGGGICRGGFGGGTFA
jgi:hypothetical protein